MMLRERVKQVAGRPARLLVLGALAIALAIVIAIDAIDAVRSRRRTIDAAVASASDDAARLAGARIERDIMSPLVAPLGSSGFAAMADRERQTALSIFQTRVRRELESCGCIEANGIVVHVARSTHEVGGGTSPGDAAVVAAWLADTIRRQAMLPHRATRRLIAAAPGRDAASNNGSFVFGLISRRGSATRLFAYLARVDSVGAANEAFVVELNPSAFLARAAESAPSTAVVPASGIRPVSVPLVVDVFDSPGNVLFQAAGVRWAPSERVVQLPPDLGSLSLHVFLATSSMNLVQAGTGPTSSDAWRVAVPVVLFAITLVLLSLGVAQLRREFELAAVRARFVSGVSHELRTPLTQIRVFAELVADCGAGRDQQRYGYARIIDEEAQRLTHLIDNVLAFAALGQPRKQRVEPVALDEVIEDTLERFRPLARERRAAVHSDLATDIRIAVDPNAIRQILLNLLDNAVKYGPPGQSVWVRLTDIGGVQLSVEDQGPGVPRSDRERVFEPFFRLPRDVEGSAGGSGIGLAVVRELVEAQHGEVEIEESARGGARVVARFPRRAQHALPSPARDPERRAATPSAVDL